jgi:hypothetical protein
MTARMSTAQVRAGILAGVRAGGAEFAMLAAFVTVGTNLIDFATVPAPGEGVTSPFVAAAIIRVLAVFYVTYIILRRMAGTAAPFRPGAALLRFFLVSIIGAILFGLITGGGARLAGMRDAPLETQWLITLALGAAWNVLIIRLVGWTAALANDAPFRVLPDVFRASRGAALPLVLAFLQIVLPFAAIHLALTLLSVRLPLSGTALAALALIDGLVSAAQLVLACALAVFAARLPFDRARPLRDAPTRR